jgi:SAM-dependent methyltransferase
MPKITDDPRRSAEMLYLDQDPESRVSSSILAFVRERAGHRVIDFGCGTGGYAALLKRSGFDVTAVDRNPAYVAATARLGVRARQVNGALPFPDGAFDTLIMIEVLEHVPDGEVESVLAEIRRVVRKNVLLTVPDCDDVSYLQSAGVTHEHFLAADHVQFFTKHKLQALLERFFPAVEIARGDPILPHLLLPPIVRRPLSALYRLGVLRPSIYSRLFAEARLDV